MGTSSLNGKIIEVIRVLFDYPMVFITAWILFIAYSNQTKHDSFITILVEFLLSTLWELLYVCLDILMVWYP